MNKRQRKKLKQKHYQKCYRRNLSKVKSFQEYLEVQYHTEMIKDTMKLYNKLQELFKPHESYYQYQPVLLNGMSFNE